jgi:Cytosine/adenosine deaminases
MREALAEAHRALAVREIPVGAVVVDPAGVIIGRGYNAPITTNDPTAHAEIAAIRQAAATTGNYRLTGCILAATLEPCLMCAGAIVHTRLRGVVFGASDPKAGAVVSRLDGLELALHNHTPWQAGGVLETECAAILHNFFASRRTRER